MLADTFAGLRLVIPPSAFNISDHNAFKPFSRASPDPVLHMVASGHVNPESTVPMHSLTFTFIFLFALIVQSCMVNHIYRSVESGIISVSVRSQGPSLFHIHVQGKR